MFDIEDVRKEYDEVLEQLGNPELISDLEKLAELSKRKKTLEEIIDKQKEIEDIKNQIEENKSILSSGDDSELVALAEGEIKQLQARGETLQKELNKLLQDKNALSGSSAIIVEIRAGTGGQEAALFARDLFRMYSKYAASQGWQEKILDSSQSELGGFKEVIAEFKGNEIFSKMKYEAGVHRVQRIPDTEKSGRIHTSTATVAVLPKPKKAEIKIRPEDLKIDFYGASGPGGQYVQKRHTAVRITHLPTGIVVTSQTERNQLQNKENALSILEARLLEKQRMAETEKIHGKRKAQIGWAKRVEKIRTYNFPQDRLTDHRIKKSWHNLEKILNGALNQIIATLKKAAKD